MSNKQPKNIFINGPISPAFIAESIAKHTTKTNIGGHSIFLGQVRSDSINNKAVQAIDYTTYEAMAIEKMHTIREALFEKYPLICMHVYHSMGQVPVGEICLFVFTSAKHRKAAIEGCEELVERIKAELPIWGKELFADDSYQWKSSSQ